MMLVAGGPGQGSADVINISYQTARSSTTRSSRATASSHSTIAAPASRACSAARRCSSRRRSPARRRLPLVAPPRSARHATSTAPTTTPRTRRRCGVALGVDKIGIWGTSYGTKLALAYALAYPTHVERLLLDSVLPTDYPEPFEANVLHDMPLALSGYCGGGACRGATSNFAGDVAAVANALARTPARGLVRLPSGTSRSVRMEGLDMLSLVVDSDLNPGLAAVLPAATHAARTGRMGALLRLHYLDVGGSSYTAEQLSAGLNAATSCADGHFPWDPATPIADRPARLTAAVNALPTGALGPFGSWAIALGTAAFCLKWPSPAVAIPPLGPGPLPDIPVLEISGGYDMRTPTSSAAAVVRSFPHGQLLVVPGIGHSVITADNSLCAIRAVRSWITGGTVPATCQRPSFFVSPAGAYPPVAAPARAASPRATLVLAGRTIKEAEAMWLATAFGSGAPVAGLFVRQADSRGQLVIQAGTVRDRSGRGADREARRLRLRIPAPVQGNAHGLGQERRSREADDEARRPHGNARRCPRFVGHLGPFAHPWCARSLPAAALRGLASCLTPVILRRRCAPLAGRFERSLSTPTEIDGGIDVSIASSADRHACLTDRARRDSAGARRPELYGPYR